MVATDGDAGPKRAGLRGIVVSVSLVALLSAGGCFQPPSYRIEKTITLPDLFAGPSYRGIAYDSRDNRILIPFQQGGTLVIDATTVRKVARVPASGPGASTYDPVADEVHLPPAEPGARFDAHRDSVLSGLAHVRMEWPWKMCVDSAAKRIYCYLDDDSLTVLDSRTLKVISSLAGWRPYNDGSGPADLWTQAVLCDQKTHRVYWVQHPGRHGPLMVTDAMTNQTIASIEVDVNSALVGYNPRANKVYVRSDYSAILVLDCGSNRIVARLTANGMRDWMCCSVRENKVYGIERDSAVVVIDGAHDRIINRIRLPGKADDLVYDSTSNRLYCCGRDWVAAIDCAGDTIVGLVKTSTSGDMTRVVFCAPVNKLYYLQWAASEVYAIDCASFAIAGRITVGYDVGAMFYNDRQDKVYCANRSGDAVAVVDAAAETVLTAIQVGRDPWALCGKGYRVYCANARSGSVSVIDAFANAVITSVKVRGAPVALCYCSRRDKVYCAGTESRELAADTSTQHAVSVIDCKTDRVVKELTVPTDVGSRIVYDGRRDRVYVSVGSGIEERVSVIDARRDTVVAEPAGGPGPDRRREIAARLGDWATGAVAYARRHQRLFAASEQSSVVVLREDRGSEDIGQALRQFGTSVGDLWGRLSRPAERAQPGIAR